MVEQRRQVGDGGLVVGLTAVILAVTDEAPRVLTVCPPRGSSALAWEPGEAERPTVPALPYGSLDPSGDRTLELALRRWVGVQTGIELGYVEQLYTFGDRFRNPEEERGGPRLVSVAYLALVPERRPRGEVDASWSGVYRHFPGEDWRSGRPVTIDERVVPALERWVRAASGRTRLQRRERAAVAFGLDGAPWNRERVLERYELLYELDLVPEAPGCDADGDDALGREMAFDHRRILASSLGRLRGKIRYRPLIFELVPPTFTLTRLQRAVEALAGEPLHTGNFRRLVESGGLVEGTGQVERATGGRPAELFRFRREVMRERPAPGVGLPRRRSSGG